MKFSRIQVFLRGFCLRNGSHASIGGRWLLCNKCSATIKGQIWDKSYCRHRRNLLRFSEMTKLNLVIVFYIHLESIVFLLMYNFQDRIGPDNVFYTIHTLYAVFDLFVVVWILVPKIDPNLGSFWGHNIRIYQVLTPYFILYKSLTDHPEVWTNFEPRWSFVQVIFDLSNLAWLSGNRNSSSPAYPWNREETPCLLKLLWNRWLGDSKANNCVRQDFTRLHHSSSLPSVNITNQVQWRENVYYWRVSDVVQAVIAPNANHSHISPLKTINFEQGDDCVLAMSGVNQGPVEHEVRLRPMCEP